MEFNDSKIFKITKKVLGVILLILGSIGLFLPFLQGIILIAAGIYLIGNKRIIEFYEKAKKFMQRLFSR